jgi:hypothetical protein
VRDFLIDGGQQQIKSRLASAFYQACEASYFAAGAATAEAAAGSEAAGAATAEAAAGAGAAAGAAGAGASACLPQADRDRANTTAIREVISIPSVDIKITGVLDLFGTHSPKSPSLRKARYSTTTAAKYQRT